MGGQRRRTTMATTHATTSTTEQVRRLVPVGDRRGRHAPLRLLTRPRSSTMSFLADLMARLRRPLLDVAKGKNHSTTAANTT